MAAAGSTTISIIPSLNQDTLIFSISAGVPIHSGVFIPAEEGFGLAAESPVHALMAGAGSVHSQKLRPGGTVLSCSPALKGYVLISLCTFTPKGFGLKALISAGFPIHSGVFIPAEEGFGLAAESPVHALMAGAGSVHSQRLRPGSTDSLMFTGPEGVC